MPRVPYVLVVLLSAVLACQSPAASPTSAPVSAPTPASSLVPATAPPASPTSVPVAVASAPPSPAPTTAPTTAPAAAPNVSASRVDVLNAASAAYARGDASGAAALYERVINTPPPASEGAAAQTITDFARFESVIALLAAGRESDARTQLDALEARDSTAPLARMGAQLWDQYSMSGGLRGACAQLQPQIGQAAPAIAALQGAGVAIDAATLCQARTG